GDEVNLAARLEGLSKLYGVTAIVSERTLAQSKNMRALELDVVRVKGRHQPTRIYTFADLLNTDRAGEIGAPHAEFLAAYRSLSWDEALAAIGRVRALGISALEPYYALFASRIADFRSHPPPANWDGAFTALEK